MAGAVLNKAPTAGTVTVMVVVAPTESLRVSVVDPMESPLMANDVPSKTALATVALLLLTL